MIPHVANAECLGFELPVSAGDPDTLFSDLAQEIGAGMTFRELNADSGLPAPAEHARNG